MLTISLDLNSAMFTMSFQRNDRIAKRAAIAALFITYKLSQPCSKTARFQPYPMCFFLDSLGLL